MQIQGFVRDFGAHHVLIFLCAFVVMSNMGNEHRIKIQKKVGALSLKAVEILVILVSL